MRASECTRRHGRQRWAAVNRSPYQRIGGRGHKQEAIRANEIAWQSGNGPKNRKTAEPEAHARKDGGVSTLPGREESRIHQMQRKAKERRPPSVSSLQVLAARSNEPPKGRRIVGSSIIREPKKTFLDVNSWHADEANYAEHRRRVTRSIEQFKSRPLTQRKANN